MGRYAALPLITFAGVFIYALWEWLMTVLNMSLGWGLMTLMFILGAAGISIVMALAAGIFGPVLALVSVTAVGIFRLTSTLIRRFRA